MSTYGGPGGVMFSVACSFVADSTDGSVPDLPLKHIPGAFLTDVGVVFDGDATPDAVTVTVKDTDGLECHPNDDLEFIASGRLPVSDRPSVVGGCSVAISGNTVNSAAGKVVLYFAANTR